MNPQRQSILILDFGSQYSHLISRRIREIGVYCEMHPHTMSDEDIQKFNPKGIILSGGPSSANHAKAPPIPNTVFTLGCPVLGICYGMQAMALQQGGQVTHQENRGEFGCTKISVRHPAELLRDITDSSRGDGLGELDVWMSHGDEVTSLPSGFHCTAESEQGSIAAMAHEQHHWYGLQFHPEVTHTRQGLRILRRFVHTLCSCSTHWKSQHIVGDMICDIRSSVGQEQVILGLSGGVDSAVAAALIKKAIGQQLICIFVDTGFLRTHEVSEVMDIFTQQLSMPITAVNAKQRFYDALAGVIDPEQKRKIMGKLFIEIFEEQAQQFPEVKWLAQGTIYPDVVESAGNSHDQTKVIKSHHNVAGVSEHLNLKLLEPLRTLFKDEVRQLGQILDLPATLLQRHPFPGPGLAIRIIGEATAERAAILQQADAIFIDELRIQDWYSKVSQAFAVWLPVKTVSVVGDNRHYGEVIALRAVETTDFMTARWARLPNELLMRVSNRIANTIPSISRVVYDISGKPPATIEWE